MARFRANISSPDFIASHFHAAVRSTLLVTGLLCLPSLLGVVLAVSRPGGCTRATSAVLYFSLTLPTALAQTLLCAIYFVFRSEAESLAAQYWDCVDEAGAAGTLVLAAGRPEINEAMLGAWDAVAQVRVCTFWRLHRRCTWASILRTRPTHRIPSGVPCPRPFGSAQLAPPPARVPYPPVQVYESSTLRAGLLLISDALLLLGLYCAGRVVGWSAVAKNILSVANGGTAIAALALVVLGVERAHLGASTTSLAELSLASFMPAMPLLSVGGGLLLVSGLGMCAARAKSTLALRVYELCVAVALVALLALLVPLWTHGADLLYESAFVASHWTVVEALYPLSKADAALIIEQHFYVLLMGGILVAFMLFLLLFSACILRRVVQSLGLNSLSDADEKAGLLHVLDEEDGEEEWAQQV